MKKNERLESKDRLEHILKAVGTIESYLKRQTFRSFSENNMLNNAVLFQFSIIGEAINHVEKEMLDKYQYPWYKVRSFRNLIAHEYFDIHLKAVWNIIEKDLPELKSVV